MKKAISFVFVFLICIFIYQFIIILLVNKHDVTYKISIDNKEFIINEMYNKEKDDKYKIKIEYQDKEYIYYIKNKFNKQKRIIKEIKVYEQQDFLCVEPITDKDVEIIVLCNNGKEIQPLNFFTSLG